MLEALYGTEWIILQALAIVWLFAAITATNMKHAVIHEGKLERWRRMTTVSVWTGVALLALWLAIELAIWLALGWMFAVDRIVVTLPLLLLPAVCTVGAAAPRIRRIAFGDMHTLPAILVPIQTMAGAVVLANGLVMLVIPARPTWLDTAFYLAMLLAFAALMWLYQRWSIAAIRIKRQGIAIRLVKNTAVVAALTFAWLIWLVAGMHMSKLPETMAMVHHDTVDYGGGPPAAGHAMHRMHAMNGEHSAVHKHADHGGLHGALVGAEEISVADLTGPQDEPADRSFTLEAQQQTIQLASGALVEAWTFNGQFPGPSLVVREGELVEVTLMNKDIEAGVTLHWHGVDVPNAEDGVAGMTQNAVRPGETYTYRFRVEEKGTHWYHSHQVSSVQVQKGLFGAFIILPDDEAETTGPGEDWTLFAHEVATEGGTVTTIDALDALEHRQVAPGTEVRLRLVNSSSETKDYVLHGAPYRVVTIDGHDINAPMEIAGKRLPIGGGGRYDIVFTMPDTAVSLGLYGEKTNAGIVFSSDGSGTFASGDNLRIFDPYSYGSPAPTPWSDSTVYDRQFVMVLDMFYFGFYNGYVGATWAINGEVFPNVPTFMVEEGDIVKTTVVNRTFADHPMHLHGHHIQVLSRNGKPISGSPLILDTLLVRPGETYEYAFVASNPGLWMDHCHNLEHAALGMSMHLAYANVTSPFVIGGEYGNYPE